MFTGCVKKKLRVCVIDLKCVLTPSAFQFQLKICENSACGTFLKCIFCLRHFFRDVYKTPEFWFVALLWIYEKLLKFMKSLCI